MTIIILSTSALFYLDICIVLPWQLYCFTLTTVTCHNNYHFKYFPFVLPWQLDCFTLTAVLLYLKNCIGLPWQLKHSLTTVILITGGDRRVLEMGMGALGIQWRVVITTHISMKTESRCTRSKRQWLGERKKKKRRKNKSGKSCRAFVRQAQYRFKVTDFEGRTTVTIIPFLLQTAPRGKRSPRSRSLQGWWRSEDRDLTFTTLLQERWLPPSTPSPFIM